VWQYSSSDIGYLHDFNDPLASIVTGGNVATPGIDRSADATPDGRPMAVQIIATTEAGTRAALLEARQLSRRLNMGRTVLLVPRIGSRGSTGGPVTDAATIEQYRHMAGQTGLDVIVRLCVCGTYGEAWQWMLPQRSLIVVGGRRRWWWPTREQRIADHLKRAGHVTVFVAVRASASDTNSR
jgi:hypothetical protein